VVAVVLAIIVPVLGLLFLVLALTVASVVAFRLARRWRARRKLAGLTAALP
jgi:uncharacterized membrane protein